MYCTAIFFIIQKYKQSLDMVIFVLKLRAVHYRKEAWRMLVALGASLAWSNWIQGQKNNAIQTSTARLLTHTLQVVTPMQLF